MAAPAISAPAPAGWDPDKPRPIRLFPHPEAIIAVAELPATPEKLLSLWLEQHPHEALP